MKIELSNTLKNVPENIFYPIFKLISEESSSNIPLLNAGIGVPDSDTPELLLETLEKAIRKPENMRYGAFDGKETLLNEISIWLKETYGIDADPKDEIALVFGTKSGLSSVPSVLLNKDDTVLLPVPSYPDYIQGIALAQANYEEIQLKEENNYLVDYSSIPNNLVEKGKLIFLNYPSNPIGAVATKEFYEETVSWAKENSVIVVQDHAYSDFYYNEGSSPCFISTPCAKDVGIEFFSFSKNFSISGLRIGFAVGNKEIIEGLRVYNSIFHANIYGAMQDTVVTALKNHKQLTSNIKDTFKNRIEKITNKLDELGYSYFKPEGSIFIWLKVKEGFDSQSFFELLLKQYRIVTMPGHVFGSGGENYIRVSLSLSDTQIDTLLAKLEQLNKDLEK